MNWIEASDKKPDRDGRFLIVKPGEFVDNYYARKYMKSIDTFIGCCCMEVDDDCIDIPYCEITHWCEIIPPEDE